jgi:hypothetical protein
LTNDEGAFRELTEEVFAQFVPFSALPAEMQELLSSPKLEQQETASSSARKPAA